MPRATNQQLAKALDIAVRTLCRHFAAGLPRPGPRQDLGEWIAQARTWIIEQRRKPGPKPVTPALTGTIGDEKPQWEVRYRRARALEKEMAVAVLERRLHSREECEAEQVRRVLELRGRLQTIPDKLAFRLLHVTDAEVVRRAISDELRLALEELTRESPSDDHHDDAEGDVDGLDGSAQGRASVAGAGDGQRVG